MDNKSRIIEALRESETTTLSYSDLLDRSGVPDGSLPRVLAQMQEHGTLVKVSDGYALTSTAGVGLGGGLGRFPIGMPDYASSGASQIFEYRAADGGMHPHDRSSANQEDRMYG